MSHISKRDCSHQNDIDETAPNKAEIMAALRSLERDGLITSSLREDGQVVWKITELGKQKGDLNEVSNNEPSDDVIH